MDNWTRQNAIGTNTPYSGIYNSYLPLLRYELIKVNGEAGAKNFRMAPNSTALLLDETAPIVWLAQTDGTGYLTVTPYDITPHYQSPQVDLNNLAARVSQLEELINAKSNNYSNKQSKKQRQSDTSTVGEFKIDSAD